MGQCQCVQPENEDNRIHPLLGRVQERNSLIQIVISIVGEEEYIAWSKKINKLKYSRQGQQFLFLPIKETYSGTSSQLFCDNSHQILLTFKPYKSTLSDNLIKNIKINNYYKEIQIWYLLDTLTKYSSLFEKNEAESAITFDQVLIAGGQLRIIPQMLVSSRQTQQAWIKPKKNSVLVIGMIALSLTCLIHPDNFYNSTHGWVDLPLDKKERYLFSCEGRYSSFLTKTLRQMTISNDKQRITLAELINRLLLFQSQLNTQMANPTFFGDNNSQGDKETLQMDLFSLKNSHRNVLSSGVRQQQSNQVCESNLMKKEQGSIHGDFPSIL